jgi:hypothetical protein
LPDDIDSTLKNVVAHINIKDISTVQKHDGYNCGIFALENSRIIHDKIQSGQTNQEIKQTLKGFTQIQLL